MICEFCQQRVAVDYCRDCGRSYCIRHLDPEHHDCDDDDDIYPDDDAEVIPDSPPRRGMFDFLVPKLA